jgi:16S rRNA (guanine527-N7)-methyltransferase
MDKLTFQQMLEERGIPLSSIQMEQFHTYYKLLVEWNEKINLTAITEENEVYLKHFFDSISAAFHFDFSQNLSLCDVGAGAGFPSIPLKICFPHLNISIVDSLNKRINFLQLLSNELGLEGTSFYHDRAETFGKKKEHRESYDIVTARAVARLSVLSELCLPLTKVDGHFIVMKGAQFESELSDAKKAIHTLGGEIEKVHTFQLPFENSERNIALINKVKHTPKRYPRKPGTPNKEPIV